VLDQAGLEKLGYTAEDLRFLREKDDKGLRVVADIRRILDRFGYLAEWRDDYRIRSVRQSLRADRITCIDAAVLSYGLLDWFPEVKRRVLAIHRRDERNGEECGHCVTLYWGPDGKVGAFSKSNYAGLGHRDPVFPNEMAVAASYARGYLAMGITPLYFGVTTLEEASKGDIDWRFSPDDINLMSSRIQEHYAYEFAQEAPKVADPLDHEPPPSVRRASVALPATKVDLGDIADLLDRIGNAPVGELEQPALTFYRGRTMVGRLNRGELVSHVERLASHLASKLGVKQGDPVALLSQNALEIPVLVLALLRLGAVIVPLNPGTPPEEWAYILGHCGAKGLIASNDLLAPGKSARPEISFAVSIDDVWASATKGDVPEVGQMQDELAIVLYTSGTTGNPKGVGLTHGNIIANATGMAGNFGLDGTTQFAVLPLYHAHAFGFGLMTSLLSKGHLVFAERFDPFTWMDVIKKEGVEVTSIVPTLLPQLIQLRVHHDKVPTLGCVMVSSAPLDPALAWAFEEQSGIPLIQGWGLSEYTNFACCLKPGDEPARHRKLLFGREYPCIGPALAPTEVTVRDPNGNEVGADTLGELWVRGPSRMRGYFKDDDATKNAFSGDWLRTGDEGFFALEDGQRVFFITGRIKEIICRGAEKFSPIALERRITSVLPELSGNMVVLGFPHKVHGEEIGVYIESGELSEELKASLQKTIESMLPDQRPKLVLFSGTPIPRTHTGKIQRRKLLPFFERYDDHKGQLQIKPAVLPKKTEGEPVAMVAP
jgi:long-chain acyl-CoA synthetase